MTLLEDYLDNYEKEQGFIPSSIYSMYKNFNYEDEDSYIIDLEFMLNNIYNIKIIDMMELRKKRMGQEEFRKTLLEQYNNKCIVTGNDCNYELEACHIVPVATKEDYSLDNGLLLAKTIHATFDKYMWSINPDTFIIEGMSQGCYERDNVSTQVSNRNPTHICFKDTGTIKQYLGTVLPLYDDMREYLRSHYNIYTEKNKI